MLPNHIQRACYHAGLWTKQPNRAEFPSNAIGAKWAISNATELDQYT